MTKTALKYHKTITDSNTLKLSLARHLKYTIGKDTHSATLRDWFQCTAYVVRDYLMEGWLETHRSYYDNDVKRVYYISMEFLIGRTLRTSVVNLGIEDELKEALGEYGLDLEKIIEVENEAALGNGGLGRLAACFLDSMATIGIAGYGYGIRYEYGMFHQEIKDFNQVEHPDNWLRYGNPWEFARPEFLYPIKFYGRVRESTDETGGLKREWVDYYQVMAMAYDMPVPGSGGQTINNLRLWAAKSTRDFDLDYFNHGNYIKALEQKNDAENISKILYPNDTSLSGKELRLKQEYFLVSATVQDVFRRYKKTHHPLSAMPLKVAIQLNDTHPSLAVAELMRLLVDAEGLDWENAWDITTRTINYTNHTILPEALEKWQVSHMEQVLPRHMEIIYEINHRFLKDVYHHWPGDLDRLKRMSIIEESEEKRIRMAHLAIVGSHKINGVSRIHTDILKNEVFRDFHELYPGKFTNKTNGISQRIWLKKANKPLSELIVNNIGEAWVNDLFELEKLIPHADNHAFRHEWAKTKRKNKHVLAAFIFSETGIKVNCDSMFDVHIKRIHEYKRQLLNVLHIIAFYNRIKASPNRDFAPRTFIFSGKAAPGYKAAKDIIMLINSVADIVNNDPSTHDLLKVVFLANYNVSLAERIIPAADLSEQISLAGTEASGTGCMKLALNGALTICTLDGACIEIKEAVGEENIFVFGLDTEGVGALRQKGYTPYDFYNSNHELRQSLDMIANGFFAPYRKNAFHDVAQNLFSHDSFMAIADYDDFIRCQERVSILYKDRDEWTRKSILNVAKMGRFSSDRTIKNYAEEIWNIERP
ncbi:MAG: glycogen/starch/alpha-glucan phosphorylase [Deltaproteobacteria bacterium]|nr:glycogen/starch/alpha-glucan phosphorylase [Deltaproteobacteria bacterium]